MPLELQLPQPRDCQSTSRYQFDFSHPSSIDSRSRRSPDLWRSQPHSRSSFVTPLKFNQQSGGVSYKQAEVELGNSKKADDITSTMSGSYGGYGAPQHNPSYTMPSSIAYGNHNEANLAYNMPSQHQQSSSQSASRAFSRPASPIFQPVEAASKSRNSIVSYLQIPATISSTRGSLAEFAAQITCLFWFESSTILSRIEDSNASPVLSTRLVPEAFPATGFLKWVTTILSTTQVTQNVILLALLFVYRLKKQNPTVKGKPGSEFRLLTVALMLGNKFLDDNTYTNKTWAEVSGISVQEIHVMEVEFLSHMKYNLYTSAQEWHAWHEKLSNLWKYFDGVSRRHHDVYSSRTPMLQVPHALPSPPPSTSASPPYPVYGISPVAGMHPNPSILPPYLAPITAPSSVYTPEMNARNTPRKRSWDGTGQEPPAKRTYGYYPYGTPASNMSYAPPCEPNGKPSLPSLPVPALPPPPQAGFHRSTPSNYVRTPDWSSSLQSSAASFQQSMSQPNVRNDALARQGLTYHPPNNHLSPIGPAFVPAMSHTPAQSQLSPSHFLTQRSSPYRPVRDMSTLLVPPPSGPSFHPSQSIPQDQMHWQTLGKSVNERHSGRVPYTNRDAWPNPHQFEQWPPHYPPNSHY